MPEIKITEESKSLIKTAGGSILKQTDGTLGDIISVVSKLEKLGSHVKDIVSMFKEGKGAGSSIIQSKDTAPPVTTNAPGPSPPAPGATTQKIDDKGMEAYFSSPEGLRKIADAIDKMVPLIGDLKLSEVKKAIMDNVSPEEKPKKRKK